MGKITINIPNGKQVDFNKKIMDEKVRTGSKITQESVLEKFIEWYTEHGEDWKNHAKTPEKITYQKAPKNEEKKIEKDEKEQEHLNEEKDGSRKTVGFGTSWSAISDD